jgi:hypothetical protein
VKLYLSFYKSIFYIKELKRGHTLNGDVAYLPARLSATIKNPALSTKLIAGIGPGARDVEETDGLEFRAVIEGEEVRLAEARRGGPVSFASKMSCVPTQLRALGRVVWI